MNIPLPPRLRLCCGFICPGDRVADVGTDHGYLGIWLLQQGIASHVIASDIGQGPLSAAIANAKKYGYTDKMTFCLSDGVQNIPHDFDTLVCAGMGAETMISILSAAPWLQDSKYRLILQCQTKTQLLRRYLSENGWRITEESAVRDGKFIYTVMEVVFDPGHSITPGEAHITRQLLEDASPLLPAFYDRVRYGVRMTVEGMRRSGSDQLSAYESLLNELDKLEEQIHGNCK